MITVCNTTHFSLASLSSGWKMAFARAFAHRANSAYTSVTNALNALDPLTTKHILDAANISTNHNETIVVQLETTVIDIRDHTRRNRRAWLINGKHMQQFQELLETQPTLQSSLLLMKVIDYNELFQGDQHPQPGQDHAYDNHEGKPCFFIRVQIFGATLSTPHKVNSRTHTPSLNELDIRSHAISFRPVFPFSHFLCFSLQQRKKTHKTKSFCSCRWERQRVCWEQPRRPTPCGRPDRPKSEKTRWDWLEIWSKPPQKIQKQKKTQLVFSSFLLFLSFFFSFFCFFFCTFLPFS